MTRPLLTEARSGDGVAPGRAPEGDHELAVDVRDLERHFDDTHALAGVSVAVAPGQVHALLGPNGAGKSTLLRILSGLVEPTRGTAIVLGRPVSELTRRDARSSLGLIPSGDRTFYLRLSGYENLLFFARLHGLRKAAASVRAEACLESVGLADAGNRRVGLYSHGMQKRLSVARALLTQPGLLLIDEATHDLDPVAADDVRNLVRRAADRGTAVLWATQRLDEIRDFADTVTVLRAGRARFAGSVPELMSRAAIRRHVVHVRRTYRPTRNDDEIWLVARNALDGLGTVEPTDSADHVMLVLDETVSIGRAIAALGAQGLDVLACQAERSEVESAFLSLVADTA